ncbi:MAG TPA: 30S ribosomal protein S8 [Candidatus Paceibacterota bacterium]|jgi:small subunit ribosomal protein S8|nr:30S ribosomal protein S8 [Candidatus Paceibacterota bacterium]
MSDPIADMIIRIKNASAINKPMVNIPVSKLKKEILLTLQKENVIENFTEIGKGVHKNFEVIIKYNNNIPAIKDVKRISKPSCRVYIKAKDIHPFKKGFGLRLLSTPHGIMSDREAKQLNLGGEVLFEIY